MEISDTGKTVIKIERNCGVNLQDLRDLHSVVSYRLKMRYLNRKPGDPYEIRTGLELGFYTIRVHEFVDGFLKKDQHSTLLNLLNEEEVQKKAPLNEVLTFLNVIKEYAPIRIVQEQDIRCLGCGSLNIKDSKISNENVCEDCGLIDFKDLGMTTKPKSTYTSLDNFTGAIEKFKGSTAIPEIILSKVKAEIKRRGLKLETLKKENIMIILRDLGENKYYDEVSSIYCKLMNIPAHNLEPYMPALLDFHHKFETAYQLVKDPKRTNSQNVNYKVYRGLIHVSYPCSLEDDFCILKTDTKLLEHDDVFRKICSVNDWNDIE
jgi:Poxvirus Late Transcription Factor VLTF3 like